MQLYTSSHPLALVCVAAPEDAVLLARWETHLHPLQQGQYLSVWSERHLVAGTDRMHELRRQMDGADLVVLLLSADFLADPECCTLMEQALERAHTSTTRVIPLLLRPAAWQESPLGTLRPWPPNEKPIELWSHQDEGWDACIQELRRLLGHRVADVHSSHSSPMHRDPDWDRMLSRLRRSYRELLDQSLRGIAWLELGLSTRPDLVSNVTNLLFRLPDGGERLLAPGTSTIDAFDEAEGELLILGAPGAGKSTLLLDLAHRLVGRAQTAECSLLPVILPLSSWALRRLALVDWMVEQLTQTYDVPRQLSERWVRQGRILPLLDGLDEMDEAARPTCIAAINTYHRTHLVPLVVCSRHAEYEAAARHERLVLQSAVIVQSLKNEQIEGYLSAAGPSFAGVRTALHQEQDLLELATTPLMLSVLLQTYRGATTSEIIQQGMDRERQVWTDYVARQVAEKGNARRYPLPCTRAWLCWLAQQMRTHQQTIFSAEYLQDDWLAHDQQHTVLWLATRLPAILLGGCIGLLIALLLLGSDDRVFLLQMGLLGGFVGSRLSVQAVSGAMRIRSQLLVEKYASFRNALLLGMLVAASNGLSLHSADLVSGDRGFGLSDWLLHGCVLGLGGLLSGWAFQLLLDWTPKQGVPVPHRHPGLRGRLTAWMNTRIPLPIWQAALVFGAGIGLSVGLSLLFPGMVVMWSLSGGLTILRHYVIRWLLARHHTFPWRAQAFLDDATTRILLRRVDGGYSFIHRRLQDYFADTAVPPSQK